MIKFVSKILTAAALILAVSTPLLYSAQSDLQQMISSCATYEDYDRLASKLKDMARSSDTKNTDEVYYNLAKTRLDQLKMLSKQNDIESGRLYMSVNDEYYNEAIDSLDKAAKTTLSKELSLDIDLLKFIIYKEKIQPQRADASLSDIVTKISQYSDKPEENKAQLSRIADKLADAGLPGYGVKIKIDYASKTDLKDAQEIFNDIKNTADVYFDKGNVKEASGLYEQFITFAKPYFKEEELSAKVMEIAEKYYDSTNYSEARRYYEFYKNNYPESKFLDYCNYKIALCYYQEKDYSKAIAGLEDFIKTYQNSIWFDKAFETLAKLYYENFSSAKVVENLQRLIDNYYRKNTGDYAQVLLGLICYNIKDYDSAVKYLKKIEPSSTYSNAVNTLLADIAEIKKGAAPSFGTESSSYYRMWEPGKPLALEVEMAQSGGGMSGWLNLAGTRAVGAVPSAEGNAQAMSVSVKKGAQIKFVLKAMTDEDNLSEYMEDKDDQSRLPKKMRDAAEKDLISLQWMCEGGKFIDENQGSSKVWQAPDEPGEYKITVRAADFGLVREPDKGSRKDADKEETILIKVEG